MDTPDTGSNRVDMGQTAGQTVQTGHCTRYGTAILISGPFVKVGGAQFERQPPVGRYNTIVICLMNNPSLLFRFQD